LLLLLDHLRAGQSHDPLVWAHQTTPLGGGSQHHGLVCYKLRLEEDLTGSHRDSTRRRHLTTRSVSRIREKAFTELLEILPLSSSSRVVRFENTNFICLIFLLLPVSSLFLSRRSHFLLFLLFPWRCSPTTFLGFLSWILSLRPLIFSTHHNLASLLLQGLSASHCEFLLFLKSVDDSCIVILDRAHEGRRGLVCSILLFLSFGRRSRSRATTFVVIRLPSSRSSHPHHLLVLHEHVLFSLPVDGHVLLFSSRVIQASPVEEVVALLLLSLLLVKVTFSQFKAATTPYIPTKPCLLLLPTI